MIRKFSKKGFSLVELLVVIAIIAVLSVVAYSAVGGNTVKARDARRKQDISAIQQALELFYVDKGKYPTATSNAVTVGGADGLSKKQLSDLPKDPQKKPDGSLINYRYAVSGSRQTYQLGATLEENGYEAYVVGNDEGTILGGVTVLAPNGACGPTNGSTACVPYLFE